MRVCYVPPTEVALGILLPLFASTTSDLYNASRKTLKNIIAGTLAATCCCLNGALVVWVTPLGLFVANLCNGGEGEAAFGLIGLCFEGRGPSFGCFWL